ncbi:hypothetical protein B0J14DRAFT_172709 [Halenospora varia]|nr:hypothetical protein B0J14DRAFT_172709 [Halenospora varia]
MHVANNCGTTGNKMLFWSPITVQLCDWDDWECSSDRPCEGDITHYDAGLGACGITSDGDAQNVVALPHSMMGPKSNDNQYCNKAITITCIATGKTTSATVVDKCMGCSLQRSLPRPWQSCRGPYQSHLVLQLSTASMRNRPLTFAEAVAA